MISVLILIYLTSYYKLLYMGGFPIESHLYHSKSSEEDNENVEGLCDLYLSINMFSSLFC